MLQSGKKTGHRAGLVLALIFLILSIVYLFQEVRQIQSFVYRKIGKDESTKFFRLLLEKDKVADSRNPSIEPDKLGAGKKEADPVVVQSIKLLPPKPGITDNIKAQAEANYDNQKVSYEYKWYINDKAVEDIKEDTLPNGRFRKNDQISVVVTPFIDGKQGYSFRSAPVLIQNSPPVFEMKEMPQMAKLTDTMELQLIGSDPDGDRLTYALDPPVLEGMTINSETGRIIWKPQKKEKGVYKFTASVSDSDGGKFVRTFEIEIK